MRERLHSLTPIQNQYYHDQEHRFLLVTAGRRSRKTLIGRHKIFEYATTRPETRWFHAAPTFKQAKRIFWENLKKDYRHHIKKKSDSELYLRLHNGSEVTVEGLDVPERIEGQTPSYSGCHITEFANLKEEAFPQHIYPVLSDLNGIGIFDGVPEGRNHYYDLVLKACNNAIPETRPQLGAYASNGIWGFYTWFASDVLDPAIIAQAKIDIDPKTFDQEYNGSFVDYAGLAYYAFGEHNLRKCVYDPNRRISIGMDFNVDPMTAVIGHIHLDTFYQFDERVLGNSNTYEMCDSIKEQYPIRACDVYPDSTGKARESNATQSDLDILEKAGFNVLARSINPRIKDRVNCVNSRIKKLPGTTKYPQGLSRFYVNPETCPKSINEFHRVERLEDGRLDKKQELKGLGHLSAGLGYLFSYNWPLKETLQFLTE